VTRQTPCELVAPALLRKATSFVNQRFPPQQAQLGGAGLNSTAVLYVPHGTDASGSEPQLHARYGQNDCVMALGRSNWLFAGSLPAGQRAANIMSLIQSAKLNGHDPYIYLKDVLERLRTQPPTRVRELLPHRWQPAPSAS